MTDLTIPPCPFAGTDGSRWPHHRAKARSKSYTRRRAIAMLSKETDRGTCYSQ